MKKKLFLLALPALMALSSCTYLASGNAQPKGNFFREEASACEEVFGEVQKANLLNPVPLRSDSDDLATPIIGVQYRTKYEKVADSDDWYIAIRFIAAVKTLNVEATWTRSVFNPNGTIRGEKHSYPTTQAYTQLNSNGEPITPGEFAGDASYEYFVAYTLYDIPFETKDDYSIVAYLTLSDTSDVTPLDDVYSSAMGVRIGGGAYAKFHKDYSGFFMYGKVDTDENRLVDADSPTKWSDDNAATFTSYLTAGDHFAIFQQSTNFFRIWDASELQTDNAYIGKANGLVDVKSSRRYVVKLDKSDHIICSEYGTVATDVYLRGPAARSGGDDGWGTAIEEAHFYNDPENQGSVRFTFTADAVGKTFKLAHQTDWDWNGIGYWDELHGDAKDGVHLTNDAKYDIKLLIPGTYDFYVNDGHAWVYFVRALPTV